MTEPGRGAKFFRADQALILTGASGAVLDDPNEDGKLYVVRFSGEDYDLRRAGEDYERSVAVVCEAREISILARKLLDMLVQGGDEGLVLLDLLRSMTLGKGDTTD